MKNNDKEDKAMLALIIMACITVGLSAVIAIVGIIKVLVS